MLEEEILMPGRIPPARTLSNGWAADCRAGTVVAVAGDSLPYKADPKALTTVLAAAQEGSVGRIILVVPQGGGGGGGGFLGGLFGGRSANPETVCLSHLPWLSDLK